MARRLGAQAEVARRGDQASAEVMQPHAVDEHARCQRVVLIRNGASEFESAAAVFEQFRLVVGEDAEELARRDGALVARIATDEDAGILWVWTINHDHAARPRARTRRPQAPDPLLQPDQRLPEL